MPGPAMVRIPGGQYNGISIAEFCLGKTPVTNAEYRTHVDRYESRSYVMLMTNPDTHATSVLCRAKNPEEMLGPIAKNFPKDWDTRDPYMLGAFTLFQLRKDMSPNGFDGANQPVVKVSWWHAFEYCCSDDHNQGLYLPTDDQWSYAAGVHEGREYATSTGELYAADGKTKLAHFGGDEKDGTKKTIDVNDARYPDGAHGLRHMTGQVLEWTDRNGSEQYSWAARGGSWFDDRSDVLWSASRAHINPGYRKYPFVGFRVASSIPQHSPESPAKK